MGKQCQTWDTLQENESVALRLVSGPMMKFYEQFLKLKTTPSVRCLNFSENNEFTFGVIGKLLDSIETRASVGNID